MLTLRLATADDAPAIRAINTADHVRPFVSDWPEAAIAASFDNPDECAFIGVDANNECVGYAYLAGFENKNSSIELRQFAIGKTGTGYGRRMLTLLIEEVLRKREKNRFWLDVFPHNTNARALYKRLGFVEEGTLREAYWWHDHYASVIVMSILKRDLDE